MNLPGFTAEAAIFSSNTGFQSMPADRTQEKRQGRYPGLPLRGEVVVPPCSKNYLRLVRSEHRGLSAMFYGLRSCLPWTSRTPSVVKTLIMPENYHYSGGWPRIWSVPSWLKTHSHDFKKGHYDAFTWI